VRGFQRWACCSPRLCIRCSALSIDFSWNRSLSLRIMQCCLSVLTWYLCFTFLVISYAVCRMVTFQVCLNRTSGLLCWIHTTTIVGNHADIAFPDYALPLCYDLANRYAARCLKLRMHIQRKNWQCNYFKKVNMLEKLLHERILRRTKVLLSNCQFYSLLTLVILIFSKLECFEGIVNFGGTLRNAVMMKIRCWQR